MALTVLRMVAPHSVTSRQKLVDEYRAEIWMRAPAIMAG